MNVEVKTGKNLTKKELESINLYRIKEFHSKKAISLSRETKDWLNLFFFLKDNHDKLLSFGIVEDLEINFQGKSYDVLCVSTVVATQKNLGYGKMLMEKTKEYASGKGKTLIGFCEGSLLPFYQKCGFKILNEEENKFVYIDPHGEVIHNIVPGEVFYISGIDEVIDKVISVVDKTVKVPRKG